VSNRKWTICESRVNSLSGEHSPCTPSRPEQPPTSCCCCSTL
jgi:hypothetical protein